MVDQVTDANSKIARAFLDEQPSGNLTSDHVVDKITLRLWSKPSRPT